MNLAKSIELLSWITAALVVLAIVILSTGPVVDGDLWWQMAYGRFLLDNGTLIPDHSVFSWTVAENSIIYCAWVSEILLYVTYDSFGLIGIGILRYLVMLVPFALVIWLMRKNDRPLLSPIWLYVFVCFSIARHAAALQKPEMFSYMFFACLVALYFAIKMRDEESIKWIFAIPLLMLIWVNSHGAFLMGCLFLAVIMIGELFNHWVNAPAKLSPVQWKYIWYAVPITISAVFITPYGMDYPLQVVSQNLVGQHDLAYQSVSAYNSIYSKEMSSLGATKYMVVCLVLLLPLFLESIVKRNADYALIALNIVFLIISASWGRFSYFSPIVMLFTFVHLTNSSALWKRLTDHPLRLFVISICCAFFVVTMTASTVIVDKTGDSRGGAHEAGYLNPESETRFIQKYFPDTRLCNGYDGGGYLLWKLWPDQKVMIDPRYFPYYSWYRDWVSMKDDPNPQKKIQGFDCNLWVINHTYGELNSGLIKMPEWKLVFMGASSAVYVREGSMPPIGELELAEEVSSVLSLPRSALILNTLLQAKEFNHALIVADHARRFWSKTANREKSENAYDFVKGTIAFYSRDDFKAYHLLKQANQGSPVITNTNRLMKSGQFLTEKLWKSGDMEGAYKVAKELFELSSENVINLYNFGLLSLERRNRGSSSSTNIESEVWKEYLSNFLLRADERISVPTQYIKNAQSMLASGIVVNSPPLVPVDKRKS